ncbi:rho GTPase-activating protein 21-like isoform X2 [Acanthaster planci]|uniref:Rho GTPase-activating protein 21-like isoform X2 n=1 Tax=Acanthaster planci TaxID=133434 RepID=A0A8B7XJ19_ACAPL|nr:rho GTPase-activating protein 21-like isoform X2 [Acanthaster planci]
MAAAVKLRSTSEASDKSESQPTWPGPRKVTLQRNATGFGFTLRHFIVYPPESAVAELSRQEGVASGDDRNKKRAKITALEPMDTIFVKHVKPEGAAERAGLSTGDRIVSVNGESVTGKSYSQVVGLIQSSDLYLKLLVVPREEDILQVAYPTSAYKTSDNLPASQPPKPEPDSHFGGRSGINDAPSSSEASYPSPILPADKTEEGHDTVILRQEPDLLSHQTRHKTEMVLSVGSKPIKTSTPVYDNWSSSREALDSKSRSTPTTGGSLDAGRTGFSGQTKQPVDSRFGYIHSRPASGISVASSTSSADSSASGQKTGRTFKITSIFGSHSRQSQRTDNVTHRAPGRNELQHRPSSKLERNNVDSSAATSLSVSHQKAASVDYGPVVRLRTGTGPNDYITLTGQRRGDPSSNKPTTRQSSSMDNLAYNTDSRDVRSSNGGQVSSSYDNLHLSGANGTEWEVRSGEQARIASTGPRLGSDSQVNWQDTVTRRYHRTKQMETSTAAVTTIDLNARGAVEEQGYKEVAADPNMRDLFMRQARHQRDRRGYEKKEASLSSSKSADSIRYIDGRPMRSNTVSAADTRPPISPTERRYSQFPDKSTGYPVGQAGPRDLYISEAGQHCASSQEQLIQDSRGYHDRQAPLNEAKYRALPVSTVKIVDLEGNVKTTKVADLAEDTASPSTSNMNTEEEPVSPTRVQDRISYWHKKSIQGSSADQMDGLSWRRGSSRSNQPDRPDPSLAPRYRANAHVPLPGGGREREKPPVPKRESSRGRVRERNMERERQHERRMYERHRSKSYDRSAQQRSAAWFRPARRQTTDDMSVDSLTSDGAISLASSRKESTASSISDGCSLDDEYPPVLSLVVRRPRACSEAGVRANRRGMHELQLQNISFRRHLSIDEGSRQRLVRRTSYLRATLSDEEEEGPKDASSVADTTSLSSMSAHGGEGSSPVVLRRNATPRRNPSINKLKQIFGEGTPIIVDAIHKPGTTAAATGTGSGNDGQAVGPTEGGQDPEVTKEGPASIKVEVKEWKRASDRSWKPVWMVLKNKTMYLLKERRDTGTSPSSAEDNPISIKASMVDIAYDYTKKKNVFRLSTSTGSEYLIQVSDTETMLAWITAIQANLTPGGDDIVSADIIMRKTQHHHDAGATAHSATSKNVLSPPNSRKKANSRSPSPALQPQPTKKQSTGLAGKMRHKMKKKGGGGSATVWGQPTAEELKSLTFGVPLEKCTSSDTNEFVPMFVDICCGIVEELGMDTVGIYRVPGNTAGVSYLQEVLKSGPEEADFTDSRWRDVNVISSLLKMFFRKLPDPLVPRDQYRDFIAANRCKEPAERMWALRRQIHNLPDHHYETFKCLAGHLRLVSQNYEVNKMEVRNLAIVFGPTLIRSGDNSMVTMVTDMSDQCCIVESIIQHCEWFFSDDVESQQAVPSDALPEAELMSSDASELLSKARKDDQSGESGSDSSKGKEINAMELMSSVISAANRKLKGRSTKKSLPSPEESDGAEYGFPSKGVDTEVKVRAIKNQTSDKVGENEDPPNVAGTKQRSTVKVTLRHDAHYSVKTNLEAGASLYGPESMANLPTYASARQQLQPPRGLYGQYGSRGRSPSGSSDNSNKASAPPQGAGSRAPRTQGSNRKAALAPDRDWKSEFAKERERIEREHQKAVRDYEKEDAMNVEELYRPRDYLHEISAVSNKIADFASQGQRQDKPSGSDRRPGQSLDTDSLMSDFSTASSNNNNTTLHSARSDPLFSTRLEIRESASESESDFVQAMKATFDERLQKVVHQESEDDKLSDKSSASSKATHNDRRTVDGVYVATPYQRSEEKDAFRVRTSSGTYMRNLKQISSRTPTGGASSGAQPVSLTSRFNELSVAPKSEDLVKKSSSTPASTTSSPTRGTRTPRKTSRIEVTLTLEKKGPTPSKQLPASLTPSSEPPPRAEPKAVQEPTPKRKQRPQALAATSKDTLSIKEQHRENRRRRHTVGGGRDAPEYRKILEYNLNKANEPPRKPSAFDRLRPFGKPSKDSQPQSMKSWMDSERVRTNSSPNLLASVAMSTPPANAPLSKPKSTSNLDGTKLSLPTRKDSHPQKFSYV